MVNKETSSRVETLKEKEHPDLSKFTVSNLHTRNISMQL